MININFCEFFYISKGVWEQFGKQIGYKEFNIGITWIPQGAVFDIHGKEKVIFSN